jgi:NAD(P)-dependent dehydrogenase (short-subunit alcohol dehydrogenase family)
MSPEPADEMRRYAGRGLLAGRRALITGGDSGIGRAVAVAFAKEGADVALAYLSEREGPDAQHTAELVQAAGRKCTTIRGDLAVEDNCAQAVHRSVETLGGLDILVNNVATQNPIDDLGKLSTEQWERTFRVNVSSYFWVTRAALDHLPDGGCIINTSSINGLRGNKTLIDYAATKGAILALTYSLAQSLQDRGIRVNCVAPGPVWTPLIPATFPTDKVEKSASRSRWAARHSRMRSPRTTCSSPRRNCRATTPARCWHPSAAKPCRADVTQEQPRSVSRFRVHSPAGYRQLAAVRLNHGGSGRDVDGRSIRCFW